MVTCAQVLEGRAQGGFSVELAAIDEGCRENRLHLARGYKIGENVTGRAAA